MLMLHSNTNKASHKLFFGGFDASTFYIVLCDPCFHSYVSVMALTGLAFEAAALL